mgnify:CR=1 FL=1
MISRRAIIIIAIVVMVVVASAVYLLFFSKRRVGYQYEKTEFLVRHYPIWNTYGGCPERSFNVRVNYSYPGAALITFGYPFIGYPEVYAGSFDADPLIEIAFGGVTYASYADFAGFEDYLKTGGVPVGSVDIDEDGHWEFIIRSSDGTLYLVSPNSTVSLGLKAESSIDVLPLDISSNNVVFVASNSDIYLLDEGGNKTLFWEGSENLIGIAAGDLDSDAGYELVAYSEKRVYVIDMDGNVINKFDVGTAYFVSLGDVTGDGVDDIIVVGEGVSIYDVFGRKIAGIELTVGRVYLADMDGDGIFEVYGVYLGRLYRLYPDETLLISPVDSRPIFADFGSDGRDDAILFVDGYLSLYNSSGLYLLYPKKLVSPSLLALTDLNGDLYPEAIATFAYWGQRKLAIFTLHPSYEVPDVEEFEAPYTVSKYHTYSEICDIINTLASKHSDIMNVEVIGYGYNLSGEVGLPIIAVRLGLNASSPGLMVIGAHHARELITAEAALYLIAYILEYRDDGLVKQILENFNIYIVPVLNPGGHDYALLYNDWARKNLHPYDDDGDGAPDEDPPKDLNGDGLIDILYTQSGVFVGYEGDDLDGDGRYGEDPLGGVDLNRNYRYSWTNESIYGNPSSDVFSGEHPLSEPETRALSRYMNETRPIIALSLHSGEETIFFPWGAGYVMPPEYDLFIRVVLAAEVASGFAAMQSCTIYEAAGTWDDEAYGYYGIISFTPEIFGNDSWPILTTETYHGEKFYVYRGVKWFFNPFPRMIEDVSKKVVRMFLSVARFAMEEIISDTTPPEIVSVNVRESNGKYLLCVKAWDAESGIHIVRLIIGNETHDLVLDKQTESWTIELSSYPEGTIVVINRAGLATERNI